MRYPLPSRADELLAMSKLRFRTAVGLLTGHNPERSPVQNYWTNRMTRMPTVWI
jgi:hypothetical protein